MNTHYQMPQRLLRPALVLAAIGAAGFVIGLIVHPVNACSHLLLVGFLGVGLGLAGALFVALHFVTGAGWSVALRRVPEALTFVLPAGAALLLVALVACPQLYPWTSAGHPLHGAFKQWWLVWPFFLMRAALYIVSWLCLAWALVWLSRRQDADREVQHTRTLTRLSALFLVVFGVTFWLAGSDWLMSRDPEWVSTIFGLYNFAGLFTSGLAVIILLLTALQKPSPFRQVLSQRHYHDLGKLLFGLTTFWAYLWYCQYMLIWYVNLPEETTYYLVRFRGELEPLFWVNLALNWIVPFFALMSRSPKCSPKVLVRVSLMVLVGRWLDLYLMVLPSGGLVPNLLLSAMMTCGALGLYFFVFARALGQAPLLPVGDPFLVESLPPLPRLASHLQTKGMKNI